MFKRLNPLQNIRGFEALRRRAMNNDETIDQRFDDLELSPVEAPRHTNSWLTGRALRLGIKLAEETR